MVKVKEIMKKYVITVDPEISVSDVAKIMTNNKIGSVILMVNMKPVGIVTADDVVSVVARGQDPKQTTLNDLPKRKLITASPEDDVLKITKRMIKVGVKRMPVLKDGRLEGIVTEKEILLVSPELIDILSEKLKMRVSSVANPDEVISGICETCEAYSDDLQNISGRWLCEDCREGQ
jgi:CBS domain-containing protein